MSPSATGRSSRTGDPHAGTGCVQTPSTQVVGRSGSGLEGPVLPPPQPVVPSESDTAPIRATTDRAVVNVHGALTWIIGTSGGRDGYREGQVSRLQPGWASGATGLSRARLVNRPPEALGPQAELELTDLGALPLRGRSGPVHAYGVRRFEGVSAE